MGNTPPSPPPPPRKYKMVLEHDANGTCVEATLCVETFMALGWYDKPVVRVRAYHDQNSCDPLAVFEKLATDEVLLQQEGPGLEEAMFQASLLMESGATVERAVACLTAQEDAIGRRIGVPFG